MSLPPSPGPYGPTPPHDGGAAPRPGHPQLPPQPHGARYQYPPGAPGGQPQWVGGPTPQNSPGKGKWILIGLALTAVIALSITGTVLVLRTGTNTTSPAPNSTAQIASANDIGPANLITEDPTCEAWSRAAREHYDKTEAAKWADRDPNIPASAWTPQQRDMYDTVAKSMETAVGQAKQLARRTPHRVMRELYGQFVAYASAFVDKIPTYVADDNKIALVIEALTTAPADICSAIKYRSVQTTAPLVNDPPAPSHPLLDTTETPQRFLAAENDVCVDWATRATTTAADLAQWRDIDPNVPATGWTPEQKAINDAAAPLMTTAADKYEGLGRASGNPVLEDFAVLAAQYWRAFVSAQPNYTPADSYLSESATLLVVTVNLACKAAH